MAENTADRAENQPKFKLSGIYVKDISFENPLAPGIFMQQMEKPEMNVSVDVNPTKLRDNVFEVALKVSAQANSTAGGAVFLVDLVYAGLFAFNPELSQQDLERTMLVECPAVIFPYARRLVSDLVQEGGFPSLLLEPLNFDGIYNARIAAKA